MEKIFSEWKNKICRDEGNAEGPLEMCGYKCIVTIVSMTVFFSSHVQLLTWRRTISSIGFNQGWGDECKVRVMMDWI